jgi:hypothetical protein
MLDDCLFSTIPVTNLAAAHSADLRSTSPGTQNTNTTIPQHDNTPMPQYTNATIHQHTNTSNGPIISMAAIHKS